jgi:hypothetical protein
MDLKKIRTLSKPECQHQQKIILINCEKIKHFFAKILWSLKVKQQKKNSNKYKKCM